MLETEFRLPRHRLVFAAGRPQSGDSTAPSIDLADCPLAAASDRGLQRLIGRLLQVTLLGGMKAFTACRLRKK